MLEEMQWKCQQLDIGGNHMENKDEELLKRSEELKEKLEDFVEFMNIYNIGEAYPLFTEYGENALDYVISELEDIVNAFK